MGILILFLGKLFGREMDSVRRKLQAYETKLLSFRFLLLTREISVSLS